MENRDAIINLQRVRDLANEIYDEIRFNGKMFSRKTITDVQKFREGVEILSQEIEQMTPECYKIIAIEDTIIENEQEVEIKTNLTGYNDNLTRSVFFNGYIPSNGYLIPRCSYDNDCMNFYIKNTVPKKVCEDHDVCGYHYCDPTSTKYFSPGIYKIEKGTTIGIALIKNLDNANINLYDNGKTKNLTIL